MAAGAAFVARFFGSAGASGAASTPDLAVTRFTLAGAGSPAASSAAAGRPGGARRPLRRGCGARPRLRLPRRRWPPRQPPNSGRPGSIACTAATRAASATETSLRMSIRHPVSLAASRAFWPSRPIASDSIRSGTVTLAIRCSSSIVTLMTCAGLSAFATKTAGSSFQGMTSIFSPPSSATTAWTRAPRCPTVAPTGSRPSWR